MNKILDGARAALKAAKCDHDLVCTNKIAQTYECSKCGTRFYYLAVEELPRNG